MLHGKEYRLSRWRSVELSFIGLYPGLFMYVRVNNIYLINGTEFLVDAVPFLILIDRPAYHYYRVIFLNEYPSRAIYGISWFSGGTDPYI